MAINYAKKNYDRFEMDWDALFDHFIHYDIFSSDKVQSEFLLLWKNRIKLSEQRAEHQIRSVDLIKTEHFPLRLVIGTTFIGWSALNIDLVEHLIYQNQESPIKVPNYIFTLESTHLKKYQLLPTNKVLYQPSHGNCTKIDLPILVFNPRNFSFGPRVIDGNNRVQFAIKNDIKEIPAYFITEKFFLDYPEIFLEDFCRDIFYFLADFHFFLNNKSKKRFFRRTNEHAEKLFFERNSLLYHKSS